MADRRTNPNYIACELHNVNVYSPDRMKVQFRDPHTGVASKWLYIDQAQFLEIERILTLGRIEGKADS